MRVKTSIATAILSFVVTATPVFAHHLDGAHKSGEELFDRALELNNTVTYSGIAFPVKQTVYRFVDDAFSFANCMTVASVESEPEPPGPGASAWHHHEGEACEDLSAKAAASWAPAEAELVRTYGTYPQVYQAYLATKEALEELD